MSTGKEEERDKNIMLLSPLPGGSLPFPEQLSDFNISNVEPDERPGFFQHHTIELSWERPDSMY